MKYIKLSQIIKEWVYAGCVGFASIENQYKNDNTIIIDDTTTAKSTEKYHTS